MCKNKVGFFFAFKDSEQFTTLGDYLSRYVNAEKLEMPMPIHKQNKHPAESLETQQRRLPKTINLYPIQ